jgi:hypothetical protein
MSLRYCGCVWLSLNAKILLQVNGPGILEGVRTLSEGGVPPRTLIIDDGWQVKDCLCAIRIQAAFRVWGSRLRVEGLGFGVEG